MALPSGQISMSQVNTELGYSSTAQISLNDSAVRTLAGVPSGAISMQNLQGKSNQFAFTISSNQTNANLRTLAINAGWDQASKVVATIGPGVYVSSNSTGTPALTISGSFPGGVALINDGYIIGMGGNGGIGGSPNGGYYPSVGGPGTAGGLALSVSSSVSITNNGTVGGGGGGGGGGGNFQGKGTPRSGGGGGGGRSSAAANSSGGAPGEATGNGSNPEAGGAGTVSAAGAGGVGVGYYSGHAPHIGGRGGDGGNWGSSGSAGQSTVDNAGGSGGSAGGAVTGNSNITWVATGTRLGSIS